METRIKPVPAFYCCYLLRSTIRHSSLYIGSSPHPSRRLAQHNGKAKGGAVRTSRASLRPWEMVCIVAGFPSNIAALQFEWAWHNTHLTRHIASEDRISLPTSRIKTNAKTGKTRKKLGRPRTSLIDKLSNLHLLLRAPYFATWPLELRFFNQKVHGTWLTWSQRVDGQIRSDIPVLLDLAQPVEEDIEPSSAQKPAKTRKADLIGKGGVEGVDPTYARFQAALRKLNERTAQTNDPLTCDVCELRVDPKSDLFNICLDEDCTSVTHVTCLSRHFLANGESAALVPKQGSCPSCRSTLHWADLMRLLSLRLRAEKEVKKLLKKRGRGAAAVAAELLEEEDDHSVTEGELSDQEVTSVGDQDDVASIASLSSVHSISHSLIPLSQSNNDRYEIIIEDSEDER